MKKQEKIKLKKQIRDKLKNYGCPDSYLDNETKFWLKLIIKHNK